MTPAWSGMSGLYDDTGDEASDTAIDATKVALAVWDGYR